MNKIHVEKKYKTIGAIGGVVGVYGAPQYVGGHSLEKVVEHYIYLIDLVGIEHIAIGTDFGAMTAERLIPDFEDVTGIPRLLSALRESGVSVEGVEKIAHGNIERVLSEILPL